MSKIIQYSILIFLIIFAVKFIIERIILIKKSNDFLNKYFKDEDKLYTLEEVANAFKLDKDHLSKLLYTLEKYHYFKFFNKKGVTMVKDFYSKYELKYLVRLLCKKIKLKY